MATRAPSLFGRYTAHAHLGPYGKRYAVGITDGQAPTDRNAADKGRREKFFPLSLLDNCCAQTCTVADSFSADEKDQILKNLGDRSEQLDSTLRGAVAVTLRESELPALPPCVRAACVRSR